MNFKLISTSVLCSMVVMACSVDKTPHLPQSHVFESMHIKENEQKIEVDQVKKQATKQRFVKSKSMADASVYAERKRITSSNSIINAPVQSWPIQPSLETNNDKFTHIESNSIIQVAEQAVSTFSVDVDTGSYSMVRKYLNRGQLPPSDAVRVEEMVNYFDYHYNRPLQTDAPFSVSTQVTNTPWNEQTHLVQIGLQGYLPKQQRSNANLVFLMDVSGSMNAPDKLPLLKSAFKLLSKQLTKDDRVSIVVYAGASGIALKPTAGNERSAILTAINDLRAGGSTNGSAGIKLAYQLAEESFIKDGINRVILATDGDFNVGTVSQQALIDLIKRKKNKGIALTTLGFGSGNYNDALMEQLADHGDGNYAYIDNLSEARKTLVGQISATLETIAKDVKIQVEWNPNKVSSYRLIGYENRLLKREDFNNDKVDAGEIGAGHTVTALYEVTLKGSLAKQNDPLRYQSKTKTIKTNYSDELAFVKLRYKKPKQLGATSSLLIKQAINEQHNLSGNNVDIKFAASVAAFAQKLRHGKQLNGFDYDDILNLARSTKGNDPHGYRSEFINLVELAQSLDS